MKRIVNLCLLLAAGASMVLAVSCRTGKKPVRRNISTDTTGTAQMDTTAVQPVPPADITPEKQVLIGELLPLKDRSFTYETFTGRAKLFYEGAEGKHELTATIRMKKDSVIWASVSALGGLVQVARAVITPDSVRVINYLQREAILKPAEGIREVLPVELDFGILQNLLIGNLLSSEGIPTDAGDFGGTWSLQLQSRDYIQRAAYNKPDSLLRSNQVRSHEGASGKVELSLQYGNYQTLGGQHFSASRVIHIMAGGGQHYIDMSFSNTAVDQPLEYPFAIPAKYTVH